MTENELERLKTLPVPPARPQAKEAALDAALRAFAKAERTTAASTQGDTSPPRLTRIAIEMKRIASMPARSRTCAIAASVAVVAVSMPVLLHYLAEPQQNRLIAANDEQAEKPRELEEMRKAEEVRLAERRERERDKAAAEVAAKLAGGRTLYEPAPVSESRVAQRSGLIGGNSSSLVARQDAARPASPVAGSTRLSNLDALRPAHDQLPPQPQAEQGRDRFDATPPNPVKIVAQEPVSTFSIDVDTASYSFVRRALNAGRLPQKNAVRVEELVNYFPYDYARPDKADAPFLPTVTVFPAPWNPDNRLVHVAIKGYDIKAAERPRANLVFLIDTSGSMAPADRLPLLKTSLKMLVNELRPEDTVGIVTYAGAAGVALEPTKVAEKRKILDVIERLQAGGSTAGAAGIQEAYQLAEAGFDKAAVNRIILATDGDFNVGITSRDELKGFIERKRATGIYLSILGFGIGNHNDQLMQALAQNGNGTAAYIDTLNEARKVLIDEASSTLFPIAKDVKIQVEFNPARVAEYRLIGYETRMLRREDFNNDKVDAGDVGSGHSVTAIYEVTPVGAPRLVDDLRYSKTDARPASTPAGQDGELGFLRLRYKLPKEEASKLLTLAIGPALEKNSVADASAEVRFATAVAAFGQLLRELPYLKSYGYDEVIALANGAKGDDPFGYRAEFVNLVRLAKSARP